MVAAANSAVTARVQALASMATIGEVDALKSKPREASRSKGVAASARRTRRRIAALGPMSAAASSTAEPINIVEFVLSQHSLFGLCFSRNSPAGVTVGSCPCPCAVVIGDLPIRQRFFMFFFGLVVTFCIAMEVSIGDLSGFMAFFVTLVVVLPLTFLVKGQLANASEYFRAQCPAVHETAHLRVEELLLLLLFLVWTVYGMVRAGDAGVILRALHTLWQTLLAVWIAEVLSLLWTYFFCATCCSCCLPEKSEFQNALAPANEPRSEDPSAPAASKPQPTEGDKLV